MVWGSVGVVLVSGVGDVLVEGKMMAFLRLRLSVVRLVLRDGMVEEIWWRLSIASSLLLILQGRLLSGEFLGSVRRQNLSVYP